MILVKRKNLYILALLVCVLLIFGELRFFYALQNVDLQQNLTFKYELESFIFASIVMMLIMSVFVFYFMRSSLRVLRLLDKIIDLSAYGKHDVGMHLKKLGPLGTKINSIILNLKDLNNKKSLKISSMSGIIDKLVSENSLPVFLLNRHGNIVNCSKVFLALLKVDKKEIEKKNISELCEKMDYEKLFFQFEEKRERIEKNDIDFPLNGKAKMFRVVFDPILNAENNVSHIIGTIEK